MMGNCSGFTLEPANESREFDEGEGEGAAADQDG